MKNDEAVVGRLAKRGNGPDFRLVATPIMLNPILD
jgi:hypothetical protein